MNTYQTILFDQLQGRRQRNPRFSLRAFARFLEMSPAHLSSLINGRKSLTQKQAHKIIGKLDLNEAQNEAFLQNLPSRGKHTPTQPPDLHILSDDEFKLISDWQHLAILSLGQLPNNRAESRWIADQLQIDQSVAFESFNRLQRLGLLGVRNGKFKQLSKPLTTTEVPSKAIRNYHRQNLQLAEQKLDTVSITNREFSTITLSFNPKKLTRAKKMINDFKHKFCEEMELGKNPSEVYTLALQFFPLTKGEGLS